MKKSIIFIFISFIILGALVYWANPILTAQNILASNKWFVLAGLVLSSVNICFRVLKWDILVGVGFRKLFPVQIVGIVASSFTPGKVGEPIKALLLKLRNNIPVSSSLPSIIWERVIDLVVLLILSFFAFQVIALDSTFFAIGYLAIAVFIVIISVMLLIMLSKKFGEKIFGFFRKFPLIKKLSEDFTKNFYEIKIKKRRLLACFIITAVPWILEGVMLYFALAALGVTNISPLILAGVVSLSVLIGVASALPGGLGTTEVIMALLLDILGVTQPIAITAVFIFRFMSFWYGAFVGGVSFVYLSKKMNLKNIF